MKSAYLLNTLMNTGVEAFMMSKVLFLFCSEICIPERKREKREGCKFDEISVE